MSEENDILHKYVWGIQDSLSLIDECTDLRKQEAAVKTLIVKYPHQLAEPLTQPFSMFETQVYRDPQMA